MTCFMTISGYPEIFGVLLKAQMIEQRLAPSAAVILEVERPGDICVAWQTASFHISSGSRVKIGPSGAS